MALTLGDNFSYQGAKPLDGRIKYDTVAAMKAVSDSTLYDGCLAYCTATEKTYQWKSTNTVDTTLGRWREFSSGGSITVDDELSDTSTNPVQNAVIKEALDGKADLVDGKVPAAQLPSYVDDVLEYEDLAHFPATGEAGKIYVALDTNKTYRWSGSAYTEISESLALGETSSTAYRGDRGKTAYDDSQTNKTNIGTMSNLTTTDKTSLVAAINEVASSSGLQLGETSSTAYRGDRGKTAYDFSQTPYTSNPEMNGTASAGSSTAWAKGDHVHPSDSSKENSFRYSTMPTASATNEGNIVQYIGATGGGYTNGYFYKCVSDGESTPTYSWEPWSVQAGGSGDDVFKGSLAAWNALTTAEKEAYKIVVLTQLHAMTLTVGDQYTINEKTFKVAEDLGNGVYAMQANTSWGSSAWPGYLAAGGISNNDFVNQSIAPYVSAANTWYNNAVKSMEADDYKYGPYLISYSKAQMSSTGMMGRWNCGGPYIAAMKDFVTTDSNRCWIGSHGSGDSVYIVSSTYANNTAQSESFCIAPAFNIDTKKVVIDDNDVITPGSFAGEVFTYNPLTGGLEAVGHTIVNSNGEEMTSRMNLKFGGDFSVTDDSTNNETVIIPHRITSEEMSEIVSPLPAAQRVMPVGFDERGNEYVVEKYIRADGKWKPIYRKDITGTLSISNSLATLATITGIEHFLDATGEILYSNQKVLVRGTSDDILMIENNVTMAFSQSAANVFNGCNYIMAIYYTKTSDTWND